MHHQQYGFANPTDRMPALLAIDHAVFAEYDVRVSKNPRCLGEAASFRTLCLTASFVMTSPYAITNRFNFNRSART